MAILMENRNLVIIVALCVMLYAGNNMRIFAEEAGDEIPVVAVQSMAIRYAEVSPEKIKAWRDGAKWKAAMPKVSLDLSHSDDDTYEIYTSSTMSYTVSGPRKTGTDYGVGLQWDLSELVWNPDQSSIDLRSKYTTQLRNQILQDVTRLYFERRRLLSEISAMDTENTDVGNGHARSLLVEKRLKVEELTAYLDALTGGGFSLYHK